MKSKRKLTMLTALSFLLLFGACKKEEKEEVQPQEETITIVGTWEATKVWGKPVGEWNREADEDCPSFIWWEDIIRSLTFEFDDNKKFIWKEDGEVKNYFYEELDYENCTYVNQTIDTYDEGGVDEAEYVVNDDILNLTWDDGEVEAWTIKTLTKDALIISYSNSPEDEIILERK